MAFDINDTSPRDQYTASAGQTVFTISFEFLADADLKVYQTAAGADPDDTADLLTLTTHYTVVGAGSNGTKEITLVSGATLSDVITIVRDDGVDRDTEFLSNGDLTIPSMNTELNKIIMLMQQIEMNQEQRALMFDRSEQLTGVKLKIPKPVPNSYLLWNTSATRLINTETPISVSYSVVSDVSADTITAMAALNPSAGVVINTKGFHSAGDGGGAYYLVKTAVDYGGTPDEYGDHTLANGNIAVLQFSGFVNLKWFGAKVDGSNDDTTEFQAAIDYVEAISGGGVLIPAGIVKIINGLSVQTSGISIVGVNKYASRIKISNTSSTVFVINTNSDYIQFRDFSIEQDTAIAPLSGFCFELQTAGILGCNIDNIVFISVWGMIASSITASSINNVHIFGCIGLNIVKYGIWQQYTINWSIKTTIIELATQGTNNEIGWIVESSNDGCEVDDLIILNGQYAASMVNSSVGSAPVASRHFQINKLSGDGCGTACFNILALKRSTFPDFWVASQQSGAIGMIIAGTECVSLNFSGGKILNIDTDAVQLSGGFEDITFDNNNFIGWGRGAAATYAGIAIAANAASTFSITNNRFREDSDFPSANSHNGIVVNAGGYSSYVIKDNVKQGITGDLVIDSGTASVKKIVRDNIGYATENRGSGTIASGSTSVVIAHGLDVTPSVEDIRITSVDATTNDIGTPYLSAIGATNFTININDPGVSGWNYGWQAEVL